MDVKCCTSRARFAFVSERGCRPERQTLLNSILLVIESRLLYFRETWYFLRLYVRKSVSECKFCQAPHQSRFNNFCIKLEISIICKHNHRFFFNPRKHRLSHVHYWMGMLLSGINLARRNKIVSPIFNHGYKCWTIREKEKILLDTLPSTVHIMMYIRVLYINVRFCVEHSSFHMHVHKAHIY